MNVPGPGSYHLRGFSEQRARNGAIDTTRRSLDLDERRGPGPAFYKPVMEQKRISFMWNAKGRFVT